MKMVVDVEENRSEEALAIFDVKCKKLEKTYALLGIEYRPKRRKIAIAFKEYSIEQSPNKVAEKFLETRGIQILEPVIDEVMAELSMKA